MDGKPCTQSVEETCSMLNLLKTEKETKNCNSKISNTASRRASGKLVFGSNANTPKIQTPPKVSLTIINLYGATDNCSQVSSYGSLI